MLGDSEVAERLLVSQEEFGSMELVGQSVNRRRNHCLVSESYETHTYIRRQNTESI
jgi:hypothetical protein